MKNTFLFGTNKNLVHFIAKVAILMALTVVLQYLTGLAGQQLLTGSIVNLMLLLSIPFTGLIGSFLIGCVTPFIALLVGLNSNVVLVPFIALGNALYVVAFATLLKVFKMEYYFKNVKDVVFFVSFVIIASTIKFAFMYFFCLNLVLPLILPKIPAALNVSFGINQLFTALIGGGVYIALSIPLKRVMKVVNK